MNLDITRPETITQNEIRNLHEFVNAWGTRCQWSVEELTQSIIDELPKLSALSNTTILDIDFENNYCRKIIEDIFKHIAECGPRHEATGTSKILHMLNYQLFVMWDEKIRNGYACGANSKNYAHSFLPRMQMLSKKAIKEAEDKLAISQNHAIKRLCKCGHTLTKVIDEYNYVKYTWNRSEIWQVEFS